ncbi:MAG: Flagellin [bacterium ADurb.Bin236]|jgi:flagellin|nr:MAG: Flagellin [bacterium ADurb.Bin236]HOY63340.1 flagellin [bacterium]
MSVVNTNISGLIGLNNLRLTNLGLQTSLERLSSGLRINHASDDPSGLAIAKGMEAQIGGIRTAVQNAEDGINLIRTADGSLSETHDILLRMRDLAVRAANEATLTTADLTRLNNEFSSLMDEIDRKSDAVTFNTKVLFDGTFSAGQVLQIGPDNGATFQLTVQINDLDSTGLGINTASVGVVANAQSAIDYINSAINQISDVRANLGIQERRLGHIIDDLKAADINISAAKSRIYDADMAVEISEFTRLQILQQSGTAILAQANAQPQSVLQLLK